MCYQGGELVEGGVYSDVSNIGGMYKFIFIHDRLKWNEIEDL